MPWLLVCVICVFVNFSSSVLAQDKAFQIRGPRGATVQQPQTIGPLSPSDTLWRVAERVKPDANISMYQVMYAFYLKNPTAFLEDNLNHLKPGATLLVPSLQEMQQVDIATAKEKSELDDRRWALRSSGVETAATASPPTTEKPATKGQQTQQRQELDAIRNQFAESMQLVETVAEENMQLKTSLAKVQHELELIKAALADDSEIQQQIQLLLAQQAELLQAKADQEAALKAAAEQGFDWQSLFKNPLTWILAASVPALLILFSILLWVKGRSKRTEQVLHAATTEPVADPTYKSPLPPLDESDELDESLFEIDDALLEDAFADDTGKASDTIDDDLLQFDDDDALSFEDDSLLPAAEPDTKKAEDDFADHSTEFDADNILSDDDLSALLAAEDDDDAIIELADDLDELDDSLPEDDSFDIDDVLSANSAPIEEESFSLEDAADSATAEPEDETVELSLEDELPAADDSIEAFDIDDLIEEVSVDDAEVDALTEQEQEMLDVLQQQNFAAESEVEPELELELELEPEAELELELELEPEPEVEPQSELDVEIAFEPELAISDSDNAELLDDEADVTEVEHSFDSSELDEFAESLAAEGQTSASDNMAELDLSNEAENILSAELAELLDQVEAGEQEQTAKEGVAEITPEEIGLALSEDDTAEHASEAPETDEELLLEPSAEDDKELISLDLTANDDPTVSTPSEAAMSVENPSKILEQYPELELLDDELLSNADFDSMLGIDSAEIDEHLTDSADIELDPLPDAQFDTLMSELEAMADNLDLAEADNQTTADFTLAQSETSAELAADDFDLTDDDFVEIDSLLNNAEQQDLDQERFNKLNVDVGLDEFADIIGEHEQRDVDVEDNGYAAKLDLVRAYIEIDDTDSAEVLLEEILTSDAPDNVKQEAQKLKTSE